MSTRLNHGFESRSTNTAFLFLALLASFSCPLAEAVYLDIHVPLPQGCVKYHALLANRLLQGASRPPPPAQPEKGQEEEEDELTRPSEEVNLFSSHTPHVTLYLADFDLEVDTQESEDADADADAAPRALNKTKVDAFLGAISSLNFTEIIDGWKCPLSISQDPSTSDYYTINGAYTMLPIEVTPCLQTLSTTLLRSLQRFLRYPIAVPNWVGELPEPTRSAAIFRTRKYGSPNVLEGFEPHVTVGFDPTMTSGPPPPKHDPSLKGSLSLKDQSSLQWRDDSMEQWNDAYVQVRDGCVDEVQGIALGKTGVGGTVLANSRMGYWNLAHDMKKDDGPPAEGHQKEYFAVVE